MKEIAGIIYEKKGHIAVMTLNEPKKLNALSANICEGLEQGFKEVAQDEDVRVEVITGAGDKSFCAGADISRLKSEPVYIKAFLDSVLETLAIGERCPKPVISAVNGFAFGGGFELTLGSDFVIASEKAKFGVPEINLGLLPGFAVVRLGEIVGRQKAKEMSMVGDAISAQEAKDLGLVLEVVPHEEVVDRAMALAEKIASKPQLAVQLAKSMYNRYLGGEEMNYAKDAMPFLFMNDDSKEGIAAFLEKRKPNFS
ncbi:MAG: enoyl-CoA hydratase/isomerase family protein [Pseudomonadales bacterium]|nr:enoyl-CoA hydratase/isomerase family protein [Pseudomonadales bacterium]